MTWETVGCIGVDAGICWLGDPCYILHRKSPKEAIGTTWQEFCAKLDSVDDVGVQQFNFTGDHPGLGVVVSTGYGDGVYPVQIRRDSDGSVAEVKVVFIEKEK